MIVCDMCKSSKCFKIELPVIKHDKKKKTVIVPTMDLCDPCLTQFMIRLGVFIKQQRGKDVVSTESEEKTEPSTLEESATQ